MTEENPGKEPLKSSPGTEPKIEQSMFKGAFFSGNPTFGGMHQTVNIQPQLPPPLTSTPTNIPYLGAANFVGREEELRELHRLLQQGGRVAITAIAGMGGVGKTELALQYAADHHGDYPAGLCWFSPRASDVSTQILEFAASMRLVPPNDQLVTRLHFIWQHWPKYPESPEGKARVGDVLLVFDDVESFDQVQPFLPIGFQRFKVLLTGRNELGRNIQHLQLDVLPPGKALELLEKFIGKERISKEAQGAADLCAWLGYLPLALELVGQYLADREELSLVAMLSRLQKQRLDDEALQYDEANPDHRTATARRGVAAAFELSWHALDTAQRELGCLLSLFAATAIPWSLVETAVSLLSEGSMAVGQLQRVRIGLVRSHLLQVSEDKQSYRLHPLIREYFGHKREQYAGVEGLKRGYCWVMIFQAQELPETPTRMQQEGFAPVVPHLAEVGHRLLEWVEPEALIWVFIGLGRYYQGQGAYAQAKQSYEQSLNECRIRLGVEHLATLISMNYLASTLYSQGDYLGARQLQEQVLEAHRCMLGEEHPDTLPLMSNLASTLYSQGDYLGARQLQEQVLEAHRCMLGEEHPSTLIAMNNLAGTLSSQGDYSGAHSIQEQVLAVRLRTLGEENSSTLIAMSNLASTLSDQGNYAGARCLEEQVLDARLRVFGEEHPDTLVSMSNLALTLNSQGDYSGARSQLESVVEVSRRVLGEEHPNTLISMNNLALMLMSQGDYKLEEQVLEVNRRVFGEEHPITLIHTINLASTLSDQGDYEQAEPLYVQTVMTCMNVLGREHPTTITIWHIYLGLLSDIVQNHPDALAILLSNASPMTKQILKDMQKDMELGNPTQEG
jgi:tetratricopeptide (TPR) repeat protein